MGMQLSYAAGPGLAPAAPTARAAPGSAPSTEGAEGAANLAEDLVEDR
jgi:hypothetical protein